MKTYKSFSDWHFKYYGKHNTMTAEQLKKRKASGASRKARKNQRRKH